MPALRERKSDIPLLCIHLIEQHNVTLDKQIQGISVAALQCLESYSWPGNIREMENELMRAIG